MKLKLNERFHLLTLLPVKGNFETLVLGKSIQKKIDASVADVEEFEIRTIGESLTWNAKGVASEVDYDFSAGEKKLIVDLMKKASEREELPVDLLNLYMEVVENDKE